MTEILGYIGALVMGITLGLIGGGGSTLTVPILVYLFSVDALLATSYSLFIVGVTSTIGSLNHIYLRNICWKTALVFGIPSVISVFCTRYFLLPLIPEIIRINDSINFSKSGFLLVLFAILMVMASVSMIFSKKESTVFGKEEIKNKNLFFIFLEGAFVGVLTGLVGAGGGFLIIPAMVFFAKLPMKKAIGTSLIIIGIKSLVGFLGDLQGNLVLDFKFLLIFTLFSVFGIATGSFASIKFSNEKLKPIFGYFVLIVGLWILLKEIF
jgi:uncharacterized protein